MSINKDNLINEKVEGDINILENKGDVDDILSLDDKLKMALSKESNLLNQDKINSLKTQPATNENITGDSIQIQPNREIIFKTLNDNEVMENNSANAMLKNKKIFKIKKYVKYNKFLNEICTDSEVSDNDKFKGKDPKLKKISPFSKVNFSKLKAEEKDERLKNLAKLVKRLRRKVRNLEHKVRFKATKLLNKHIWNKLGINTKNKYLQPEFQFDFDKIYKALRKVQNYEEFEFADQKHLIENLINFLADDKLKLDSLSYKRICSIIRKFIPKEKIKHISKKDSKITVSFPETEVYISSKEFSYISKFQNNEEILRAILDVYDSEKEKIVMVREEPPVKQNENLKEEESRIVNKIPTPLFNYCNIPTNIVNSDHRSNLMQNQLMLNNNLQMNNNNLSPFAPHNFENPYKNKFNNQMMSTINNIHPMNNLYNNSIFTNNQNQFNNINPINCTSEFENNFNIQNFLLNNSSQMKSYLNPFINYPNTNLNLTNYPNNGNFNINSNLSDLNSLNNFVARQNMPLESSNTTNSQFSKNNNNMFIK